MERYSFDKAYEEASKMREKIEKGEAKNYYDAERLVNKDDEQLKRKQEHQKDFGHEFEDILVRALKNVSFIDKVEHGTKSEDEIQKVDLWFTPKGMDEPIGVQISASDDETKLKDRRKISGSLVRKEKRSDAEINWDGKAELVFVEFDKRDLARFWKTYKEKAEKEEKINPEDVISKKIMTDFFSQVLKGVNPAKRELLMENLKKLANH